MYLLNNNITSALKFLVLLDTTKAIFNPLASKYYLAKLDKM